MEDLAAITRLLVLGLRDEHESPELWVESCRDLLRTRLGQAVQFDHNDSTELLGNLGSFSACTELLPADGPALQNILADPQTPPVALRGIARQAKRNSEKTHCDVESTVERAIYFAAIAAAEAHHGCRITRLPRTKLVAALQQFGACSWILPPLGEVYARALQAIEG